jgi:DNA polymerase I-like protein with 3'-5' exonuclease and polymerase domains
MSVAMKNYDLVRSVDELADFFNKIVEEGKPFGFDIETGYHGEDQDRGSLRQETNLLVGFSFTNSFNWARYCPMAHDFADNVTDQIGIAIVLWNAFKTGLMVAHNAGYELRRMARFFRETLSDHPIYGAEVRESDGYFPILSCTQVEAYIERRFQDFDLKGLTLEKFGHKMIKFEELFEHLTDKKKKAFRFNVLDLSPKVITYACEDALWCLAHHLDTYPKVKNELMYKVDMEITYVICEMEDCGIRYDWFFMQEASTRAKEFAAKLNAEVQAELAELLGMGDTKLNVNLGSPKQLSEILYDRLGLEVNVFTASTKGAPKGEKKMSTGKMAMDILAEKHPTVRKISDFKNITRLTGSFLDKYAKDYGYAPDGMVHPSLNQSYVRTARFSSANPNQQNQPSVNLKDDDGKTPLSYYYKLKDGTSFKMNFRDSVIAPDDFYILGFDLSQAEYRAAAGLAEETALIEAFETGEDVHTKVAAMMFKVPKDEVTKQLRSKAKTLGFGLLFGMTASALAKRLNCSIEEAEELFAQYFAAFPKLKRWTEKQVEYGYQHGYVFTKFGRRIPIWELSDSRRWIREGGERACYNYPVQGGATGDYVRIGMVRARKAIRKAGWKDKVKLFMNVHDALEFYVHRSLNPAEVISVLQPAVIFPVPGWPMMKADWHVGKRWGSVKELEVTAEGNLVAGDALLGTIYLPTLQTEEEQVVELPPGKEEVVQSLESFRITEQASQAIVVEIKHMPTEEQYLNFIKVLEKLSGPNAATLVTPEGPLPMTQTTRLDPEDSRHVGVVSLALGGATVGYEVTEVNLDELAADLAF